MKHILYFTVIFFAVSCTSGQKGNISESSSAEVVSQELAVVDVNTLLDNAQTYDGQEVLIKGTVTHVCKHSGKRLHLMGIDEQTMLRLEAGKIGQFERELEGSDIIARGVFRREVIDEEYLAKWADEMGMQENHMSHEEQEEEQGRMRRYRQMMKETEEGYLENFWVDGISFETVEDDSAI